MDRRSFLATTAAAGALTGFASAQTSGRLPVEKGLVYGMLGRQGSYKLRFQMAKDAGFECVELYTTEDPKEVEALAKASQDTGLRIHGVMNQAHWAYPLSSSDPAVVKKSMDGMKTSLQNAKTWGADTVLLVPAVVNPETTYEQAILSNPGPGRIRGSHDRRRGISARTHPADGAFAQQHGADVSRAQRPTR